MRIFHFCRLLMLFALFCNAGLKPASAVAETLPLYDWSAVGPYNGAVVMSYAIDQAVPSTVYAGLDGGGVYKSTDGGASWNAARSGIEGLNVYALAMDPLAGSAVYAGTNNGLYRTFDGGASWHPANPGNADFILALAASGSNIYAGTASGVFRSGDGGANWSSVTSLGGTIVQALTVTAAGNVFAGTTGGIFESSDDGATWTPQNTGMAHLNVTAIAANPANSQMLYAATWGGGIFKTTDGGTTWTPTSSGVTEPYVRSLAINPLLPDTVFAGTNRGAFRTTTGGNNWSLMASIPANAAVSAVAATPASPATIYAGTNNGIYRSTDGGLNWFLSNSGITSLNVQSVLFTQVTGSTVYAGANGGIFRSANRGTTWAPITTGLGSLNIHALAGHSSNQYLLYAATEAGVFRSINGGSSWASYSNGLGSLSVFSVILDPALSSKLYAGTDAGVYKSIDGGITWTAANNGISDLRIRALAMLPGNPQIIHAGAVTGLYRTTDGGETWNPAAGDIATLQVNAVAADPAAPGTVFAATDSGIFRSGDGGVTWEHLVAPVVNSFVYTLLIDTTTAPSVVYAGTEGGVFFSTDGGNAWAGLNSGLTNRKVRSLAMDPWMRTLYAGTWGSGVFRLPAVDITVSPAPHDFGNVSLYTVSSAQSFTLSNTGSYGVTVSSINLSGTGSSMFQLSRGTCPSLAPTLLPGESCAVTVAFAPGQLGASTAALNIASNSVNYPLIAIPLSGTGIVQAFGLSVTTIGTGSGRVTLPSGTVCSGSCSEAYVSGSTIDLTASPDIDSSFVGWSGCDSVTDGVCRVVMNGAKTVSATFDKTFQLGPLYPWVRLNQSDIWVYTFWSSPSAEIIVVGGAEGIFRSTDGGNTWTRPSSLVDKPVYTLVNGFASSEIYAAVHDGVYVSLDSGDHWARTTEIPGNPTVTAVATVPSSSTVYAGTLTGIYMSSDRGMTWTATQSQPDNYITTLVVNQQAPSAIYAGTGTETGGIFKSTDGGSNWTRITTEMHVYRIVPDPVDPARVYATTLGVGQLLVSNNGGTSWTRLIGPLVDERVWSVAIDPGNPSVIVAGTDTSILTSFDNGATWTRFDTGFDQSPVLALHFSQSGLENLFAGTMTGVWRTSFAQIALSPETKDFTQVNIGKASIPQDFTITNTGTAPLVIDSISITGTEAPVFDLEAATCGTLTPTLNPGTSCKVRVTFVPEEAGLVSATLRIHSNAPAASLKLVPLFGEGVIPLPDGFACINDTNCRTTIISSTSSPIVTLYITPYDYVSPVTAMRISNDNFIWTTWEPFQSTRQWTLPTGDGTKTVYIELRNEAGLVTELPLTAKIILNTQPPVATITSMPVEYYSSATGTFTFTANETDCTFECSMDGGNFLPCSSPFSFQGLADGSHGFAVRATNAAGILQATPSSYTWSIDTVAPETSITSGPASGLYAMPFTFTFVSPETGLTFQCSIDGGAYAPCASPYTSAILPAGTHTFRVRTVDAAGNADATPAAHQWSVLPPTTTLITKPANPAMTTSAIFEFISPAPGATFECSLDFGVYAACTSPATFTNLGIGSHTFTVRAKDAAGTVDTNPPRYTWTVMSGPIKLILPGNIISFHSTLAGALASIPTGTPATVLAQSLVLVESGQLVANTGAQIIFKGGYDAAFATQAGMTSLSAPGSLVIQSSTLEVSNMVIM